VVVQSNLFNPTHASVVVCPVTSHLVDAPLFRLLLPANAGNGLKADSQVMVDKLLALRRDCLRKRIGALAPSEVRLLDRALRLWLALDEG
jgi:mRNA interferase MazF